MVRAAIDAWTGGMPGPWTRATTSEWFIDGTQPGARGAVDINGLLYSQTCGWWGVDPVKAELGPTSWDAAVADWASRARSGPGRTGPFGSRTAYFWGRTSWGGPLAGSCGTTRHVTIGGTKGPRGNRPPKVHRHKPPHH
ncbi:MAG: hypothetical protein ACHQXL_09840 [Candidatus Limnocylindrales bacterium]